MYLEVTCLWSGKNLLVSEAHPCFWILCWAAWLPPSWVLLFGSAGILRNSTLLRDAGLTCSYKSLTVSVVTTAGSLNDRKEMQKGINLSHILSQLKYRTGSSASRGQMSNSSKGKMQTFPQLWRTQVSQECYFYSFLAPPYSEAKRKFWLFFKVK